MFKHAYVRGIQTALVNSGNAAYPDEHTAAKVADYIADRVDLDPFQGVTHDTALKVAAELMTASDWLLRQPNAKIAAFNKLSSWDEVYALADRNAVQLMTKAAEGSTIEGGDKGNMQADSTAAETRMDARQRPPGYAEDSRGDSAVDTRPGAVGKEEENPNGPSRSPSGDNSVQQQSRTASLAALFRKAAEGSTIEGGDKGNMEMSSAEAKLDAMQRPPGYAVLPGQGDLGEMMQHVSGPAVIGRETPHSNGPGQTVSGSNSITQTSAKAAGEDAYISLFKKTAAEVSRYLPRSLTENDKVAAVRACMGMTTAEKAYYLSGLRKEAAESGHPYDQGDHSPEITAHTKRYDGRNANQSHSGRTSHAAEEGGLPDFLKKKMDEHEDSESEEEEREEHEDGDEAEEKKEAALRKHLRRLEKASRR